MKRLIALFLALVMCLPLGACNISGNVATAELAETVSTDLIDFTLIDSSFTYYVSNSQSSYVKSTNVPNDTFVASTGNCFVSLTFTLTSKDRGSIAVAGSQSSDWRLDWTVKYNGKKYDLKGFDLNNNSGRRRMQFGYSAIMDPGTNTVLAVDHGSGYRLHAGETVTIRTFGVINVDPDALTDGYELTINVPNSDGKYEHFTYTVPARS